MANAYDTFGNPKLRKGLKRDPSTYNRPMLPENWPLSANRRESIMAKLAPLIQYAETAPATDPGDGYWDGLDATFGCGENAAIYQAAEMIRGVLTDLGIDAPTGFALCSGCSRPAGEDDHDPNCTVAEDE